MEAQMPHFYIVVKGGKKEVMGHLFCPPNTQGQLHVIGLLNDP